jgi:hypothetical protein
VPFLVPPWREFTSFHPRDRVVSREVVGFLSGGFWHRRQAASSTNAGGGSESGESLAVSFTNDSTEK